MGRKEPAAKGLGKNREVLEKQTAITRLEGDEASTRVTRDGLGERLDEIPHVPAQAPRRNRPVRAAETRVPQRHAVPVVAEEQFIGAFAREHDLDVLASQPRDEIERDTGRKCNRFVFVPHQLGERVEILLGRHDDVAMLGADRPRREARELELVGVALEKTDRECTDRLFDRSRNEGRQRARVETARQEHAQRHVAHQMAVNRRLESIPELGDLRLNALPLAGWP